MSALITTASELDALPVGSVVRTADGDLWEHYGNGWDCLSMDGATSLESSETVMHASLMGQPTVLHDPNRPSRTEAQIKAEALREAAQEVAGLVRYGAELRPDGREDPLMAAYVEGLGDAYSVLTQRADRIESGKP